MDMTDDRATEQSLVDFLSQPGSGGPGKAVDGSSRHSVVADGKPTRTRNLRATFRATPGTTTSDPGFSGTRSFASHGSDGRAPGSVVSSEGTGNDPASAPAPGSSDPSRRDVAIQQAGRAATADGPGEPAAARAGRGRVRGRVGRPPGSGAAKEKPAKAGPVLPAAIKKLIPKDTAAAPSSTRLVPTEEQRADARRLFREIGERFNVNRKRSKTAAYSGYRHDLMANLDTLVMGGALDLKDATTIITNLEQYTKETEAESTETPATILGRWLRMEPGEVGELEVPAVEEAVVEELGEEVDELDSATDPLNDGNSKTVT